MIRKEDSLEGCLLVILVPPGMLVPGIVLGSIGWNHSHDYWETIRIALIPYYGPIIILSPIILYYLISILFRLKPSNKSSPKTPRNLKVKRINLESLC